MQRRRGKPLGAEPELKTSITVGGMTVLAEHVGKYYEGLAYHWHFSKGPHCGSLQSEEC